MFRHKASSPCITPGVTCAGSWVSSRASGMRICWQKVLGVDRATVSGIWGLQRVVARYGLHQPRSGHLLFSCPINSPRPAIVSRRPNQEQEPVQRQGVVSDRETAACLVSAYQRYPASSDPVPAFSSSVPSPHPRHQHVQLPHPSINSERNQPSSSDPMR